MYLYVIDDYRCRDVHYEKGQVLEVPLEHAAFLLVDAPGCFSLAKAPEQPPKDKMQRKARIK